MSLSRVDRGAYTPTRILLREVPADRRLPRARHGPVTQGGCWVHARRKFVEGVKTPRSNLTKDAFGRIRKL